MWNRNMIIHKFGTDKSALRWCLDNSILPKEKNCPRHRTLMMFDATDGGLGVFTCNEDGHNLIISISKGTFLENTKLPLYTVFSIMYSFCNEETYEKCIKEAADSKDEDILSVETVSYWYNFCHETVVDYFLKRQEKRGKIGGSGKIVQITKRQFGRTSFNMGLRVLGIIEDGSDDLRFVLWPDNINDADSLIPMIKQHVAEGSRVSTNVWKDHSLVEHGFQHSVMSEDRIPSKQIVSSWKPLQDWFRKKCVSREKHVEALVEYQWRRECRWKKIDIFDGLLNAIILLTKLLKV